MGLLKRMALAALEGLAEVVDAHVTPIRCPSCGCPPDECPPRNRHADCQARIKVDMQHDVTTGGGRHALFGHADRAERERQLADDAWPPGGLAAEQWRSISLLRRQKWVDAMPVGTPAEMERRQRWVDAARDPN